MMDSWHRIFILFIRFSVVGLSGLFVDFGLTWLLKEKAKVNKYASNTVGFLVAASSNYYFDRIWAFANTDPAITYQYFKFIVFATVGVAISNSILLILHGQKGWNFYKAKVVATIIVVLWNFTANYFFTFR